MVQYVPPTTCKNGSLVWPSTTPMTGTFFDYPQQPTSSPSSACSMAPFNFTPLPPREVEAYAMANAFHRLSFYEIQEVNALLLSPFDVGVGWGFFDELDQLRNSISSFSTGSSVVNSSSPPPAAPSTPDGRPRRSRVRCQEELARRLAHRRSLQKGYEKTYRARKRGTRQELRVEWLELEHELKHKLVAVQNSAVYHPVASVNGQQPPDLTELDAECTALRTEQAVMQSMLATEARLQDAGEYFTQSKMREQLNALAAMPSMMGFTFVW